MHARAIVSTALIFFLHGCSPYGPEELDRLVKEDPEFAEMIATRDKVHAQIRALKKEMLERKRVTDAQVERLRGEYDVYAKSQNLRIEKMRSVVQANRNVLKQEIDTAGAQLAAKEKELEGYEKTLLDVKKILSESKRISLSSQEKQKWEERILLLSEKIRPLSEDIQELKARIRLKKRKMGYLH